MGIFKTLIKISFLVLFLFGISQIEVNNKKVYKYVEAFAAKLLYRYGDVVTDKVYEPMKKRVSGFVKEKLTKAINEEMEPTKRTSLKNNFGRKGNFKIKTPNFIKEKENEMDEERLKQILGD